MIVWEHEWESRDFTAYFNVDLTSWSLPLRISWLRTHMSECDGFTGRMRSFGISILCFTFSVEHWNWRKT